MNIDTLLLSGGGAKITLQVGALKYLIENNIINVDYSNIKKFITCSCGSILGLLMSINMNINVIEKILINMNYLKLFNLDDLDDLLLNNGLFTTNICSQFLKKCLSEYSIDENINLIDFYNKTNKELYIKVYNLTKQKTEYFSYHNNPNIKVIDAILISCNIPIVFKPIYWNNQYYVDGGISGNNVDNLENNNYINLYIEPEIINYKNNMNFLLYLLCIYQNVNLNNELILYNKKETDKVIVLKPPNGSIPFDFSISNDDKAIFINIGYDICKNHLDKHSTNGPDPLQLKS